MYPKRKNGKSRACVVKLGMAKAYDRLEWEYQRGIMLKRCLLCGSSHEVWDFSFFSIKVNRVLIESFRPTQRIRQGDLISLHLFLLCSEGLFHLLKSVGPMHLSRGV